MDLSLYTQVFEGNDPDSSPSHDSISLGIDCKAFASITSSLLMLATAKLPVTHGDTVKVLPATRPRPLMPTMRPGSQEVPPILRGTGSSRLAVITQWSPQFFDALDSTTSEPNTVYAECIAYDSKAYYQFKVTSEDAPKDKLVTIYEGFGSGYRFEAGVNGVESKRLKYTARVKPAEAGSTATARLWLLDCKTSELVNSDPGLEVHACLQKSQKQIMSSDEAASKCLAMACKAQLSSQSFNSKLLRAVLRTQEMARSLTMQSQKAREEAKRAEEQLLEKFLVLLNSKKARIAALESQLGESSPSPAEEDTGPRKRAAPKKKAAPRAKARVNDESKSRMNEECKEKPGACLDAFAGWSDANDSE